MQGWTAKNSSVLNAVKTEGISLRAAGGGVAISKQDFSEVCLSFTFLIRTRLQNTSQGLGQSIHANKYCS